MVYNPVLIAGAAAWAAAQVLKVIINAIKGNGFMPERFFGSCLLYTSPSPRD